MKRFLLAAVQVVVLTGTAFAADSTGSTARIELRAFVPVICRADFESTPILLGSRMQLGAIHEFCNAGSGYQVVVQYIPTSDPGMLLVDGRPVQLDMSGRTVIQRVAGPAVETSLLGYIPGSQPIANLHVSMETSTI